MKRRLLELVLGLLLLAGIARAEGGITSKATLNEPGRRIGVSQGSAAEEAVAAEFPEASIVYYTDNLLGYTAVAQGKLDAYVYDLVQMQLTIDNGLTGVHLLPEVMNTTVKIAVGYSDVSAISDLEDKLNRFIAEVKSDGTLDGMYRRWVLDGNTAMPEIPFPENPELHLTVATTGTVPPYSYYEGGGLTGYNIELGHRFAAWLGADVSFQIYDFDGVVPAAKSGKVDVIMSNLQYLPERSGGLPFSDILYEEKLGIIVRGDAPAVGDAPAEDAAPALDAAAPAWRAYNGKRLGVLIGPLMEDTAAEYFPDSKTLILNSYPDCIAALLAGKIDAYLGDEPSMKMLHAEQPDIDYIHERITQNNYSFAFRKNDPKSTALCGELNDFLARSWADGTMAELDDIWFGMDEDRKVVDMSDLTGKNGTIRVVTTSTDAPFSYIKEGKNVGYDIDLVVRFCRDRGYALELGDVDFAGRIPAIQSGKYDFTTDMNVTPEREEEVLFSDPTSYGGIVLAVRSSDLAALSAGSADGGYQHPQDLAGKRVAVQTGTISGEVTQSVVPDILLDYYNSQTDAMAAVKLGKADAWATDEPLARFMLIENTDLWIADHMDTSEVAAVFARTDEGQALRDQYSAFVDGLWADGTMEQIDGIWFGVDEDARTVLDYEKLPDTNGTLRMAVDTSIVPFAYVKDNRVVGYDVDIAARFCEANGYRLEVVPMSFDGVLPSVQTGKCDFAACCITITEERAETVLFSSPNYHSGTVVVLRRADGTEPAQAGGVYTSLSQLNGKRIGVQTGTSFDNAVSELLPDAKILYFNTKADLINALLTNKIDAYTVDEPVAKAQMQQNDRLSYIPEYMESFDFAYVFPKTDAGQALCNQFSEYLTVIRADGTMEAIEAKWFSDDDSQKTIADYSAFPAPNGKLRMATEAMYEPFSYISNNEFVGYDIDIAVGFCEAYGYGLEIVDMSFDAILPSVQSGKCDFGGAGITITEERRESILYSEPNFSGGTVMAVLKDRTTTSAAGGAYAGLDQLDGKRIGVQTGTINGPLAEARFPDAQVNYFNSQTDVLTALKTGKVDAWVADEPIVRFMKADNPELTILDKPLAESNLAAVFAKTEEGQALCDRYSAFIDKLWADGTMAEIDAVWFGADDAKRTVMDYESLPATNGTLRMAADLSQTPFTYMKDNRVVGYDVDIASRFCKENGYALEIVSMSFDGILPSVQSGKCDFSDSCITITEERAESVLFSSPNYLGGIVVAVWKGEEPAAAATDEAEDTSFWGGIKSSFHKTFLREGRWRLFADGVLTTLLITLLAILFGTLLGFALFMLCRNGNPVANLVTRFCLWLVQGMPMVVLLMILYYVIFGSVAISGVTVAVIGFTMTFGAAVYGLLKMGVGAVDNGQYEAAYALGYTNLRTFFRIILPQALPHVLPAYRGEIVGLIKATAVVGYIAVQDLTKMGDIVRSRTYEAFFPLIAVTVIYFVLEALIGFLVSRISVNFDPKRRKPADILKGVRTDD